MKKLTLLSVCAFALTLGAANADTPTVGGGENLTRPERGADMPLDTNRTLEATPDTTVGSGQVPEELGENEEIVDDEVNLGEGDTAPDEEETRMMPGTAGADDTGVLEDEPLETGTIFEDTTEDSSEDDALNTTTGEEESEGLGDDELSEEDDAAY